MPVCSLLIRFKEKLNQLPGDSLAYKIVVIDNWNEWAEGHYVGPCIEFGFQFLQAIREVLTDCDMQIIYLKTTNAVPSQIAPH